MMWNMEGPLGTQETSPDLATCPWKSRLHFLEWTVGPVQGLGCASYTKVLCPSLGLLGDVVGVVRGWHWAASVWILAPQLKSHALFQGMQPLRAGLTPICQMG